MINRMLHHVRANAVAYVALCFAVGGGSGAAIAATVASSGNTVHACVSKKNGAVYIAQKCSRSTRALIFNKQGRRGPVGAAGQAGAAGPAGTSAVVAWAAIAGNGNPLGSHNMTVSATSPGVYAITVTAPECQGVFAQAPVVTPLGNPAASGPQSGIPTAWANITPGSSSFTVTVGFVQNGSFVPGNEAVAVQDQCG